MATRVFARHLIVINIILLIVGARSNAVQPGADPEQSPLSPFLLLNEAFDKNDPAILASVDIPDTVEEKDFVAAEQALLVARGKLLAVYQAKIDPDGKSPLSATVLARTAFTEAQLKRATITMVDDQTANVDVPNALCYRVNLVGGKWRIQIGASIGSKYPSDPTKALSVIAKRFRDVATAYNTAGDQIAQGKLTSPENVAEDLTERLKKIFQEQDEALPPPVTVIANDSFDQEHSSAGFVRSLDESVKRLGEPTLLISSKAPNPLGEGNAFHNVDATPYLGKRVRISAMVKSSSLGNWGGIGMVAIAQNGKWLRFDTMSNQLIGGSSDRPIHGTSDWTKAEIVTDVPADTARLLVGLQLKGPGELWLDGAKIEVVGEDVPTTDDRNAHLYSDFSPKYSLAMDKQVMRDGHPVVCVTPHGPPSGAHSWYGLVDRQPDQYLGHHIRLSAWMKCQGDVHAHLSLVAALPGRQGDKEIDNRAGMPAFPINTTWHQYEVTGDAPADMQCLTEGDFLFGKGKVWIDDMKVEVTDGL